MATGIIIDVGIYYSFSIPLLIDLRLVFVTFVHKPFKTTKQTNAKQ